MRLRFIALATASLVLCACGGNIPDVERLNLRDPRLSQEARRWLADTEDEVAIAKARMEGARQQLDRIRAYENKLEDETVFSNGKGGKADAKGTEKLLLDYVEKQKELREVEFETADHALGLARARLTQVRAETAIRYDLAVYEMTPIVDEVNRLKEEVAGAQTVLEDRRAAVEKSADALWRGYAKFVKAGGKTSAFWKFRSISAW